MCHSLLYSYKTTSAAPEDAHTHTKAQPSSVIFCSQMIINNFMSQHIIADEGN